jgi:glycerol transport system substrate-binding protein
MESVMERIERSGIQGDLGPVMNDVQDAQYWLDQPGAPKPKLANEDEEPMTIGYDELVASWN